MFKKTMKKIACTALAITSVVACAGTFTACETAHPEVKMVLQFNNKNYDLEYKLYRNIAPSTTNHFLWLVENGYYNRGFQPVFYGVKKCTAIYRIIRR